jgi:hypothetical protein
MAVAFILTTSATATELRVDLNTAGHRRDVLSSHCENWAWPEGRAGSRAFGDVTVTLSAATNEMLGSELFKGLLDDDATVAADGVVVKNPAADGGMDLIVHGLSPGEHRIVTYHNEVREMQPAAFNILVDGRQVIKNFVPSWRATNDYEMTSACLPVKAVAGRDVIVHFQPVKSAANRSIIINGFAIDVPAPHKQAVKPSPANDDEHWLNAAALTWTAPADAVAHEIYFGTDSNAVATATTSAPEFKGKLRTVGFPLPTLDHLKDYFWRVDEVDAAGHVTRGEVWRFRARFLAFPTAEGYGRYAARGRGGRVI